MARGDLIEILRTLAPESAEAAADCVTEDRLAENYMQLRQRAEALNREHGWASQRELATQLPTLEGLSMIESLDVAYGQARAPDLPVNRGAGARLVEALTQVSGWATGLRMAYETLQHIDGD